MASVVAVGLGAVVGLGVGVASAEVQPIMATNTRAARGAFIPEMPVLMMDLLA